MAQWPSYFIAFLIFISMIVAIAFIGPQQSYWAKPTRSTVRFIQPDSTVNNTLNDTQTISENLEGFEDPGRSFFRHPRQCPALLDAIDDKEVYDRLGQKLTTVKNDGKQFLGFFNGERFDDDAYDYCYINTFDHTQTEKHVPCSKDNDAYRSSMINAVREGSVFEPGNTHPREVCIMEIDKTKVADSDVLRMGEFIDAHDNSHLLQTTEQYKEQLSRFVTQAHKLKKENEEMAKRMTQATDAQKDCATQRRTLIKEKELLQSQIDALNNRVVVIGEQLNDYEDTDEPPPRLVLYLGNGGRELRIPREFNITHVFVPSKRVVRLIRINGTSVDFSENSENYPSTSNLDVFHVEKLRVLGE